MAIDKKTKSILLYLQARINDDAGKSDLVVTKHLHRESTSLFLFGAHLTQHALDGGTLPLKNADSQPENLPD